MHFLNHFLATAGIVMGALFLGIGALYLIPHLEGRTKRITTVLSRAPALDWIVTYFMILPLIVCPIVSGWAGILGAITGQVLTAVLWIQLHELTHREARKGPRIIKVLNGLVGPWRNHTALWITVIGSPIFWLVRMMEVFAYPAVRRLVGFPRYDQGDWVNISRHKFEGLVGHDLIWCLYCDWMTGLWSLGTEMLRNVESFWCPIRFLDDKKCENCSVDFPDLNGGWVNANATMQEVASVLEKKHFGGFRGWFGHPVRITVKGELIPGTVQAAGYDGTPGGNGD